MKKVFVAYNTDSIINLLTTSDSITKKYKFGGLESQIRTKHNQLINAVHKQENTVVSTTKPTDVQDVSKQKQSLRKKVFKEILQYYKKNAGKYDLYFDILDTWKSTSLVTHYDKNGLKIKSSEFVIFVIADEETSFWQLQEIYFASYYNKKIIYLKTEKFLKLIARGKRNRKVQNTLDNYIEKVLAVKKHDITP